MPAEVKAARLEGVLVVLVGKIPPGVRDSLRSPGGLLKQLSLQTLTLTQQ